MLSVPWSAVELALGQAGPLSGKVLCDCTNALTADYTGLAVGATTSGGEIIAGLAPGARVVKGIPPSAALLLSDNPTIGGKPVGCFLYGDDPAAKATVSELARALPTEVVDFGPLTMRASPSPP